MNKRNLGMWGAPVLVLAMFVGGCGDDDDDSGDAADPETTTTMAPGAERDEFCAVAQEIFDSEEFPVAEQIDRYKAAAPEDLHGSIDIAGTAMLGSGGELVATLAAAAEDDVEAATAELNAFEEANCAIPHSANASVLPEGASYETEADATRVNVAAADYEFTFEEPIEAGRTSFVMTNNGAEAHFLGIGKLKDGVTVDQALEAEDPTTVLDGQWETNLAAPGGDEETITFDLEPGNYAMVCFLPDAEGTPHAFLGMVSDFAVS